MVCIACLVVGLGILVACLRIFSGHVLQRVSNSTGSLYAEVIDDDSAAATDVNYLAVGLKSRFNPIRHYVFGGSNYGAQIRLAWINDRVLLIRCEHCEELKGGNLLERKWHQVTICYSRSNVPEVDQNEDPSCPRRFDQLSNIR